MNPIAQEFAPLTSTSTTGKSSYTAGTSNFKGESFQSIYQQTLAGSGKSDGVVFSKHANERLSSRNLNLSDEQMTRLNDGVQKARGKNIKDSLIIVDGMSFLVNVPNNTVITALGGQDDQAVFTNIDGAVIS